MYVTYPWSRGEILLHFEGANALDIHVTYTLYIRYHGVEAIFLHFEGANALLQLVASQVELVGALDGVAHLRIQKKNKSKTKKKKQSAVNIKKLVALDGVAHLRYTKEEQQQEEKK